MDETRNKTQEHDIYQPKKVWPRRKLKENHKLPCTKDGFQTYFSRKPPLIVMNISMGLVDPLALDTI